MNLSKLFLTAFASASLFGATALPQHAHAQDAPAEKTALPQTKYGAPNADQKATFWGSKEDPAAKKLLGVNEDYEGRSYLHGDEWNLHLYYPHIKELGGGYVGVGADQGYLLMGWTQAEYGWLVDYDPLVPLTHKVYHAFFMEAATPKEFLAFWDAKNKDKALAAIEKHHGDHEHIKQIKRIYTDWRKRIQIRHRRVNRRLRKEKIPAYTNNQEQYDHIRGMIATGRIRPMLANLLDDEGLTGIGEASKKMNVPIRILYLSNAQEYWKYPDQFRANVASLNFDERSYTLHTLSTWSTNKDYRYVLQPGLNFQEWMAAEWVPKVYRMIPRRKLEGEDDIDFIEFNKDVKKVEARRNKKKKKKKK